MSIDTTTLPNNIDELKLLFVDTQQEYENEIKLLKEKVNILQHRLFGKKSEKLSGKVGSGQLSLFNETEQIEAEKETATGEEIKVPAHSRRRGKRKPLPESLPRIEVIHDIAAEEKQCACGAEKSRIGQTESEQLDIIPPKVQVIKHIRFKYACKCCEGTQADEAAVSIAPMPDQLLPKSIATAGLLSYIVTSKYVDALPLYRQEQIFKRLGVDIVRQTMSAWVIKAAERCTCLLELLNQDIRSGPLIQMDETRVQVLDEPGRAATKQSYMWLFRGGLPERPSLIFQYHPERSSSVAKQFLGDYQGYVQTDGYVGYEFVEDLPGVEHLGCWAHVRRKFMEAVKARGKTGKGKKKKGRADEALEYIGKLYAIEQSARDQQLSFLQIKEMRQKKARPVLDEFEKWLEDLSLKTPPSGLLGTAVSYALGQWNRLAIYIKDGRLHPDNNLSENAIRPFVLGRKNWMFSATPAGAHASATLYSLIETAKANGLEPYWYLRYLFDRLPSAKTTEDYKGLLPQNVEKKQIGLSA
jgi:transposase